MPVSIVENQRVNVKDLVEFKPDVVKPLFDIQRDVSPQTLEGIRNALHEEDLDEVRTLEVIPYSYCKLFAAGAFTNLFTPNEIHYKQLKETMRGVIGGGNSLLNSMLFYKFGFPEDYASAAENVKLYAKKYGIENEARDLRRLENIAKLKLLNIDIDFSEDERTLSALGVFARTLNESGTLGQLTLSLEPFFHLKVIWEDLFKIHSQGIDFHGLINKTFKSGLKPSSSMAEIIMYLQFISADEINITNEKIELVTHSKQLANERTEVPLPERRAF